VLMTATVIPGYYALTPYTAPGRTPRTPAKPTIEA
jgi:hypothetical protein